ncbi:hypothetical protein Taro_018270 [Colocasia esculenta]|uniref:Uncharacterized protein n=1 Tax=Colocasia esculenta TaxID=4460 RepID=A0A843UIB0_COLES|nr:hypothetical protein [Colocasia esculenta]
MGVVIAFPIFEGSLRNPPLSEKATFRRSRSVEIATLRTRVEDKTSVDAPDRETSQQQQGARRAEEMVRQSKSP